MRVLVNATSITIGGGVQKAVEFVRSSVAYRSEHAFHYALSDVVANNLQAVVDPRSLQLTVTDASASMPLAGRRTIRALRNLESRLRPDVVFTLLGPAYMSFRSPHLMGFAVPWITHPNQDAWRTLSNPLRRAWNWAWLARATYWVRFANRWVLETAVAANGLARVLGVEPARCHVVPNICGEQYYRAAREGVEADGRMAKRHASDVNVLVFSAWYPHKNLELVPLVAAEVRKRDPNRSYRFFLTFETTSPPWRRIERQAKRLGVEGDLVNLGTVMVADGPRLYQAADILFLPTLLESFTATYPEAMCLHRPIVTTDLPFARDICGDAAMYFPPNDAATAAEKIVGLVAGEAFRADLVMRGERRLATSKTSEEIYRMVVGALEVTAGGRGRV
jgi:glycosyltransferase involved in cell wall biosynthesis